MTRRPDSATLVSGIAIIVFGTVLLLDRLDALRLSGTGRGTCA